MRRAWPPVFCFSARSWSVPQSARRSAGRWAPRFRLRSREPRSAWCWGSILSGCGGSVDGDPVSAVAEDLPAAPERPSPSRAHWLLALRNVAWAVLVLAYPLFQWTGWGLGAWFLCAVMWTVQRLIQAGVNRFVLDLPPTPAVAVAGVAFLTRALGHDHRAGGGRAHLGLRGRRPCCHPVRGALHDRQPRPRSRLGRVQARAQGGRRVMRRLYGLATVAALALALPAQALASYGAEDRPHEGVPARSVDQDPEARADRPVDHEGRLLPPALDGDHHRRRRCSWCAISSCTPSACRPSSRSSTTSARARSGARRCPRRPTRRGSRTSPRCSSSSGSTT